MLDGSFGKCARLRDWGDGSYIEFYLGYNYNRLNLSFAPVKGMEEREVGIIEVYGDDVEGDLLFESQDVNYRTHITTVNIDVSNCEFLRVKYGAKVGSKGIVVKGYLE